MRAGASCEISVHSIKHVPSSFVGGLALSFLLIALTACGPTPPAAEKSASLSTNVGDSEAQAQVEEVPGTVRYLEIEGGCWAIELNEHNRIQPLGLPKDFAKDGLKVLVRLEPIPNAVTTCQIGPLNRVVSIRLAAER